MSVGDRHTIHRHHVHHGWDNALAAAVEVESGSVVELEVVDASGGQLGPGSSAADIGALDFDRVNPVTGPVYVRGARPGDVLEVELLEFGTHGWGWTGIIPGFGLLADRFEQPALKHWEFDEAMREAVFRDDVRIPVHPFPGTIGVAPAESGTHSVVPPRSCGGNMDIRHLTAGTTLYLPVQVEGALFSAGDTHAAQGDGEVCGTAIESAMQVSVTLDLIKDTPLAMPRFSTPGPVTRHLDGAGYEVFTGIGPDLMTGARQAVEGAIDWLGKTRNLPAEQAYMLCSVCGDLRISEIVDAPNWVVSFYLPRIVFE
jgi:acetamidase/formamidase